MAIIIDGNNTPTLGGVGYGDGSELAFTAAGTSGQVLTSNGSAAPSFAAAPGPSITDFAASGTWTKPTSATFVMVEIWGAGGGGCACSSTTHN